MTPSAVRDAFGRQTDEPELAINAEILFGLAVWMRRHRKGDQALVKEIIARFKAEVAGGEALYQDMVRRLTRRQSSLGLNTED